MSFWNRTKAAEPVTAADAARMLGELGREAKAKRADTLARLKACVDTGRIAHLGWK